MRQFRLLFVIASLLSVFILPACTPLTAQYVYPLHYARYVSPGATIIVRYGPILSAQDVASLNFTVKGSQSGLHTGRTLLADDQETVIFKPSHPFTAGEQVSVNINPLQVNQGTSFNSISYFFTTGSNMQPGSPVSASTSPLPNPPTSAFPNDLTLPQDIPHYTITKTSNLAGEGDIFVAPFYWTSSTVGSYLLILDQQGQIVYYQSMASDLSALDFKELPDGLLSYYDQKKSTFYLMNSHYQVVNSYQAGDGYTADVHDFVLMPNGNVLLMIYDNETVDMSRVVVGGLKNATVTGLVIQELDPSKNVVWEWRSWDHFSFLDTTVSLATQQIDWVHGNGLALASDGNLLLSSRNLSEITKINLQTGEIIWRLGGKANQFTFVNDQPFAFQHNIAQLANGNITLFDNHGTQANPAASRALEYQVDAIHKTVTKVWSYSNTPPIFGMFMGDNQRLPDGNIFLDWGAPSTAAGYAYISMTELDPAGNTLFELSFDQPYVSYRAFLSPWQGTPDTLPALAYKVDSSGITLGYSWNGATGVASYQVYGGNDSQELSLVDQQVKTGFETQSYFANPPLSECYFQVTALDKSGKVMAQSNVISTDKTRCP
jgi:hypothetical protein